MKKLTFTFLTVLFFGVSTITAQDSKFYLGGGAGYASMGGDVSSDNDYKAGFHINFINFGYRIKCTGFWSQWS